MPRVPGDEGGGWLAGLLSLVAWIAALMIFAGMSAHQCGGTR